MKIHVEKLNKTFDVTPTNKVIRSVYQFQLDSAKLSNVQGKKAVDIFSDAIKMIDNIENFLTKTLGLSKEESKKLDDEFEQGDITEMANYVASRLMGMPDKEIKEEQADNEDVGPKK
ncbi:phage tail tube assembly chaperone [Limosilactobacillus vaginalis]|uniref:phage tail tube assembly chaperone n=1 Tax=Limosilactobacillus vaginalis TaxID=1633 RepID=UPI003F23C76B